MRPISRNAESPGMQTGRPRAVVREDEIDPRASPVNSRGASGIVIAFAWPGCGWTHSTLTYPPECRPNPRRQSRSGASPLPAVDDVDCGRPKLPKWLPTTSGGDHILPQQGVMAIERDQPVVALLGFGEIGKGPDNGRSVVLSTRRIEPSILTT
jgi:hypothetical protein